MVIRAQKIIALSLLLCGGMWVSAVQAGIVMIGTRVIFPAESKEKTIQLSNNGDVPFLVQVWLDKGNIDSVPQTADAPFIVNPQVFRIDPHVGQMSRLVYTGEDDLPKDRESIFYLNFTQTPAMTKGSMDANKLVLVVKNRLKVFYRPKSLVGSVEDMPKQLTFSIHAGEKGAKLEVNNPSAYYASFTAAKLKVGGQDIDVKDVQMIAPRSSSSWFVDKVLKTTDKPSLEAVLVNDYGAMVSQEISLKQQ